VNVVGVQPEILHILQSSHKGKYSSIEPAYWGVEAKI